MKKILSAVIITVSCLCALPFFSGCPDAPEDDKSISEITIYNIPVDIPVFYLDSNNAPDPVPTNPAYKIYINASNHMDADMPPAAKGTALLGNGTRQTNGTHTVTIKLQKPNPATEEDPDFDSGPWSGAAAFFSVMISPQDVSIHKVDSIWAQGSMLPLNKGMKRCDWKTSLTDFRTGVTLAPSMEFDKKTEALYTDIILKDPDITRP